MKKMPMRNHRPAGNGVRCSVGVITHNVPRLKTAQVVYGLLRKKSVCDIILFALPFIERKEKSVLFPHRPGQEFELPSARAARRRIPT